MSTDDPTDDLQKPLGQSAKKKKKPFVLPVPLVTRAIACALGFCIAVLIGWILFVDEPFGGEPVAVVSALPNKTAAATSAAKPDATAPVALGETDKPATAANTVTIIDGSTGKRQEVSVGQSGAAPAAQKKSEPRAEIKNAPLDPRLADTSRHGAIPKIASDGARPSEVYARPVTPSAGRTDAPRVAIIIEGLGVGANSTAEALAKLPAPVTFAFAPYGTDLERWVGRARGEGHEVMLQIGMEPFDYPDNDPGPQTLLATLPPEQNIDRLHWFLSRFQGYVGVTSLMGARFTATDQALSPVIRDIGKRGLIYFDDGASPRSVAGQISGAANVAFAKADAVLDAVPTAADIDNALARLEAAARSRGVAIGAASALPVSIERIAQWAKAAEGRGIVLVPVSMVANRAKTGS